MPAADMEAFSRSQNIARAMLVAGVNRVRIRWEENADPPRGFEPAEPTLEDAYLLQIHDDDARSTSTANTVREAA